MGSTKQAEYRKQLDQDYENTRPGKDAQTSDYYQVESVPERFNKPDRPVHLEAVNNPGNPVFSCCKGLEYSGSFKENEGDKFKGYQTKDQHPMYMTTSSSYGSRNPTVHTMPKRFHAKSQKFSEHLGKCGMYRNESLNTSVDKSKVSSHLDGLF